MLSATRWECLNSSYWKENKISTQPNPFLNVPWVHALGINFANTVPEHCQSQLVETLIIVWLSHYCLWSMWALALAHQVKESCLVFLVIR